MLSSLSDVSAIQLAAAAATLCTIVVLPVLLFFKSPPNAATPLTPQSSAALIESFSRVIADCDQLADDDQPAALPTLSSGWRRRLSASANALMRSFSTLDSPPGGDEPTKLSMFRRLKSTLSSMSVASEGAEAPVGKQQQSAKAAARPVLEELKRTEDDYVADLRVLAQAKAALVAERLLSASRAQQLFGNVDVLLKLNLEFLERLGASSTAAEPSFEGVAQAFSALTPYFRLYAEYCSSYFGAVEQLQQLRSGGGGGGRLQRRLAGIRGANNASIDSLLIKPVQRLTKYPLLLKELLGRLPAEHPQRASLSAAAADVAATNAEVNARVARAEADAQLMQAHADLGGEGGVLAPSRALCHVVDVALGTAAKRVHRLYVFSDAALLAAPRRGSATGAATATGAGAGPVVGRAVGAVQDRVMRGLRASAPRLCARRWFADLAPVAVRADGCALTLSEAAVPGAPPPEPPLVVHCESAAAANVAAEAVRSAQAAQLTLNSRSGFKSVRRSA